MSARPIDKMFLSDARVWRKLGEGFSSHSDTDTPSEYN